MERFMYLVQCKGDNVEPYPELQGQHHRKIVFLSWKLKNEHMIYFPNSTWTAGRNRLLLEARVQQERYDYYIFLDDDILFNKGSFDEFEQLLLKESPAVATPLLIGYPFSRQSADSIQAVFMFDACMNAFHHSIIFDDAVFPYCTIFDKDSWWYSQYVMIHLLALFYEGHVIQLNNICIINSEHGDYPKNIYVDKKNNKKAEQENQSSTSGFSYFDSVEKWIYSEYLSNCEKVLISRRKIMNGVFDRVLSSKIDYSISKEIKKNCFKVSPEKINDSFV
ncbi:hypothetical protein [Flagellimonas onchidii]|uniref:hypothetical protein n=1 Tax=Flagellimonas onchidii TaxID=2562684 RepID=UPI0010A64AD6|nr:hypothetical protein [Allomuricauda onchidii]